MNDLIKKVVVVGGGTSGWITAARLAKKLDSNQEGNVEVTLIESPNIAGIGVGEGTFPSMRETLKALDIPEAEFIKNCNATFKQGIKFVNWEYDEKSAPGNHYYHLFNTPHRTNDFELTDYWLLGLGDRDKTFAHNLSEQAEICDLGLAPKKITTPEYQALASYAYHLDAKGFVDFLKKWSIDNLGVKHLVGHVDQVKVDENGYITGLETKEFGLLEGELFIDCTGFSCLLLGKTLGVPFKDKSDILFVDHALAMQVPYDEPDAPIACSTISTAHEAGWTWDIGLQTRRGIGYVYSSNHTSHERAEEVLRNYIGKQSEGLNVNRIKMRVGYREKFWHKNCVAVGFSAGFFEPLESTALILVEAAAAMLSEQFPYKKELMPILEKKFNAAFEYRFERIVDFVKLHYFISKRTDSEFWKDNRNPESAPQALLDNLTLWKSKTPTIYDFPNIYETFTLDSYQWILYGLNYQTDLSDSKSNYKSQKRASKEFNKVQEFASLSSSRLPKHRELIDKICEFGLSRI